MEIGKFLKSVGTAVLKNVPMGGLVYDIADAVLDQAIPDDVTGNDLDTMLKKLPPDQYLRVMSKQIDADVKKYQSWSDLHKSMENKTPASKSRAVIAGVFGVGIMAITVMFTYVILQHYLNLGTYPPVELAAVVYGIPAICVLAAFGVRSEKLLDLVLTMAVKRMK